MKAMLAALAVMLPGLLAHAEGVKIEQPDPAAAARAKIVAAAVVVDGKVLQRAADGMLVIETYTVQKMVDVGTTRPKFRPVETEETVTYFIVGHPKEADLADGDPVGGKFYPAGVKQYTSVGGANRTVRRLAATPELAMQLRQAQGAP